MLRFFRKSNEFPHPRAVDRAVPAWVNKELAPVRYVPNLGTGTLEKDSPVMAGLKSPNGWRLCEILNHTKGIKVYGWIAEADLSYTAP